LTMRVAYFTNKYPAVSHTFIRREIKALEALGVPVLRYALRPAADKLVDVDDLSELNRTRYILKSGATAVLFPLLATLFRRPAALVQMASAAVKMGRRSDRGLLRHFAYVLEAVVLATWCRRDKVQHVHVHFGTNPTAVALLARILSGVSYSFTAHGPVEFERATLLSLDRKLSDAAFAICVSSFGRSQLMRWSSPDQWEKIAVVHCGVDSRFLEFPVQEIPAAPQFVCVGRLVPQKAQLLLVAAARHLKELGYDFKIVLAGDGEMRARLEQAIAANGLQRHVFITGWISGERVRMEIVNSRALISASFSENLPVVIMEAMALNRPVIATYVAGIPELVQDQKTGFLIPAGDELALVSAMREVLDAPIARLSAMGAAARSRVLDRHNVVSEAKKLESLFEKQIRKSAS
jgi:glycosyltransferase involved in cell wall biosynthesis